MNLDSYLRQYGIEGADFAQRINITPASVSRIRRGDQNITRDMIRRIVEATDGEVTPADLVFHDRHELASTADANSASTGNAEEMSGGEAA